MQESLEAVGLLVRTQIIWAKNNFAIGRGHYHVKHEPCWYAVKKSGSGHWAGDRSQTTLWQIDKPLKSETGHSTQKPVECMHRPIENNSSAGQAVYSSELDPGRPMPTAGGERLIQDVNVGEIGQTAWGRSREDLLPRIDRWTRGGGVGPGIGCKVRTSIVSRAVRALADGTGGDEAILCEHERIAL